jgi:hypothetical protein
MREELVRQYRAAFVALGLFPETLTASRMVLARVLASIEEDTVEAWRDCARRVFERLTPDAFPN